MSRSYKLFIGQKIREIRTTTGLTQADFATRLGISTSYFNQIENNQRHLTAAVILALAEQFNVDIASLGSSHGDRLLADLTEALADPVFAEQRPSNQEIKLVTQNAPGFAYALLALHGSFKKAGEQLAELDSSIVSAGTSMAPTPYEEVRDFFHYQDNYIDALDTAGEQLAKNLANGSATVLQSLIDRLADKHRIHTIMVSATEKPGLVRQFDEETNTLYIGDGSPNPTKAFQLAFQIALHEQKTAITEIAQKANLASPNAIKICEFGLANYFAGAILLPYEKFAQSARAHRHDVDALATEFGASLEQVSHRLSTLQRPGKKGIPFFFAKLDQAGNISKRHSATKLQFARFGSACPLWNAHQAFETPNKIIRQLAETTDGTRYLSLATETSRRGEKFNQPSRRYALALGCEIKYADELIYADDLDIGETANFEPIGVSCRICERTNCIQRAVPPIYADLDVNLDQRSILPYRLIQ